MTEHVDVLIVGAGLSGIGAACHLQRRCPDETYVIFEARDAIGGTWDLFRYPGIRSDSDMFTLGYAFEPWQGRKAIADGPEILSYIRQTARKHGIAQKIRFRHRACRASWSSEQGCWTVEAEQLASGETVGIRCRFLWSCAGYYRYDRGYTPDLPGRERFPGPIVHPQFWSDDVAYEGKRVVVIGSGATAMTLVPQLAKKAAHVVMLQRSPTYVMSLPAEDALAQWLQRHLPERIAYDLTRGKNVALGMLFYQFARRHPELARRWLLRQVRDALGPDYDVETHFSPRYNPWDQRLCIVPDGDLFESIRAGRTTVVTDHIETFTERGILLRSGRELEADLIVTATGLELQFCGGMTLEVDGRRIEPSHTTSYKGAMLSDVPNFAVTFGYTNASWTLKADLTAAYVCALLRRMDEIGAHWAVPRRDGRIEERPFVDFSSGYIVRALDRLPKQGHRHPWRVHQNYFLDLLALRMLPIDDGVLEFGRAPRPARASSASGPERVTTVDHATSRGR